MGCPSCQAPATLAASLVTLCTRRSGPKTCAIPGQCSSGRNEKMGSTHLAVRGLSLAGVACLRHREGLARQCHCNHCTRAATTMHCLVQSARERQGRAVFPCVCLHRPCVRHLRHCYRESCCAERAHTPKRKHNPEWPEHEKPGSARSVQACRSGQNHRVQVGGAPPFCANLAQHTLCWTHRHRQTPANERNANVGGSAATPPFSGCASPNPAQPGEAPAQSPQWLTSMPAGPLLFLPR